MKNMNDNLGSSNRTFSEGVDRLVETLNSPAAQPSNDSAKTTRRSAVVVPAVQTQHSTWKSLKRTKLHKYYWCEGKKNMIKRRRFPCLKECCSIDNQSSECKFHDRFGEIEELKIEHDPAKKIANAGRSSERLAKKSKSAPPTPRRRSGRTPGRRQGQSRK